MIRTALSTATVWLLCTGSVFAQSVIAPTLSRRIAESDDSTLHSVYLVMSDQLSLEALEQRAVENGGVDRHRVVMRALREHAEATQTVVMALLESAVARGEAKIDHDLWVGNAIAFTAEAPIIEALARTSGVDRIRAVVDLPVSAVEDATGVSESTAPYPFSDDFESGALDPAWVVETTGTGIVGVTADYEPLGEYHVTMSSSVDASESTAGLTVCLDLAGRSNVGIQFMHKIIADEMDPEDGVFVSADGGQSWHQVLDLTGSGFDYGLNLVDLDAAVAALGLAYTSDFRVRFSWGDNYTLPTDGAAFDDIAIGPGLGTAAPEPNIVQLQAPQLWEAGFRGENVLIASIDSGVDPNHPDLADRLWTNPGEIPGNLIDDEGNGYIDDVIGYDFIAGDGNPTSFSEHGTLSAGLMVGDGTSGRVTGMAPEGSVVVLAALDEVDYWAAQQYAIELGVDVISSSVSYKWFQPPQKPDYAMHRAVCNAELAAGIIHSNSTGNQGEQVAFFEYPIPFNIATPANCPQPWGHPDAELGGRSSVLACAGIELDDSLYTLSGRGPSAWEDITVYASSYPHDQNAEWFDYPYGGFGGGGPGLLKPDVVTYTNTVTSTTVGGGYAPFSGTSAAAPQLGGGLALLKSVQPAALPRHLAAAVELTAEDLGIPGKDTRFGAGKLQVFDAARRLRVLGIADDTTPAIGSTFSLDLHGVPDSTVFAYFAPAIADGPGDFDLLPPFFSLTTTTLGPDGVAALPLTIPNDAVLVDAVIHFQFGSAVDDVATWGPGPLVSVPEAIQITN